MYFETAGIEASPLVLPLVAFSISFFTSMGGVSGAFLLLPFQMSVLGFTSPAVSPTNQVFNITAIPAGLRKFSEEGRMIWPLAIAVVLGTVPGVLLGAYARVRYLPDPTRFKVFVGFILLVIGVRLVVDLIRGHTPGREADFSSHGESNESAGATPENGGNGIVFSRSTPTRIEFQILGRRYSCNRLAITAFSFAVGIVGGAYGIGGGSIMAPFFVAVLGLPVHAVAGAALAGTLATSTVAVAFYHAIAPFYPEMAVAPDWKLGFLLGLGGVAGIWLGAKCQKHVPARAINWMLSAVILFVAVRYLRGLIG